MTKQELHLKYGENKVGVVKARVFDGMDEWTPINGMIMNFNIKYKLRYKMELDPHYRQLIPYIIIRDKDGRFFTTRRKAGDARLTGKISLGVGGHIEEGEHFWNAVVRELNEEVEFKPIETPYGTCAELTNLAYIVASETEVDRVHAGVVMQLSSNEVSVRETDVLEGSWMTLEDLWQHEDEVESWGQIVMYHLTPSQR